MEAANVVIRGKEVLIKVVACVIPMYIMGCFKVPKKMLREDE